MKIILIGKPKIVGDDGCECPVPGHQSWAVLAKLLRADRPITRRDLAANIFPDTEDPMGALRWCLASLRRATGSATLQGDPIDLNFPTGTYIDIRKLDDEMFDLYGTAEFLEGIEPAASDEFSTWLMIEREQIASKLHERLRRESIQALSAGNYERALALAMRAATSRPLDESGHIILVKCLAMTGNLAAAIAHVEATEIAFKKEIGEMPSHALRAAARKTIADIPEGVSQSAVVDSLIKASVAAVSAGAVDAGLDCLRRAAADAEKQGDNHLFAIALQKLGTSLVHGVRGFDDEGAIVLRQAADVASHIGSSDIAARALSELGYVEALAGRRPSAANYLEEALSYADGDLENLAGVHAFMGFNLVDWGQVELGVSHFEQSLDFARSAGDRRREIWSLGIGAWGNIRSGRLEVAKDWLTSCLTLCDDVRWLAFRPWPIALLAEAKMALGKIGNSSQPDLEEALALSGQLGDPCWQAATARSLALLHSEGENYEMAEKWMSHARERCCAVTDLYVGLLVEILSGQIALFQKTGREQKAVEVAREMLPLAAKTHADAYLDFAASVINTART